MKWLSEPFPLSSDQRIPWPSPQLPCSPLKATRNLWLFRVDSSKKRTRGLLPSALALLCFWAKVSCLFSCCRSVRVARWMPSSLLTSPWVLYLAHLFFHWKCSWLQIGKCSSTAFQGHAEYECWLSHSQRIAQPYAADRPLLLSPSSAQTTSNVRRWNACRVG